MLSHPCRDYNPRCHPWAICIRIPSASGRTGAGQSGFPGFQTETPADLRISVVIPFGFEPEITAKIAKGKWRVYEVPISYAGRTYEEGKKITWKDGVKALGQILRYNLFK